MTKEKLFKLIKNDYKKQMGLPMSLEQASGVWTAVCYLEDKGLLNFGKLRIVHEQINEQIRKLNNKKM